MPVRNRLTCSSRWLVLLFAAWAGQATAAPVCPLLPDASGLSWQEQAGNGFLACRATAADGREVMSLMLMRADPGVALSRSLREEKDVFAGEGMHWYRPDLGGQQPPGYADRRITVVKLEKDQYAQLSLYPRDGDERASLQQLVRNLDLAAGAVAAGR